MLARRSGFYAVDYRHINLHIVAKPASELYPDRVREAVHFAGDRSPEGYHANCHVSERFLDELELSDTQRHQP